MRLSKLVVMLVVFAVILSALAFCSYGVKAQFAQIEIHHVDVGQADCTLVVGTDGTTVLIDLGEINWNSSANAQEVVAYLQGLGITHLDYFVVSHFHSDHIGYVGHGGLWYLYNNFSVGQILHRDTTNRGKVSGTFYNYIDWLPATTHSVVTDEQTIPLGSGAYIEIVLPDGNGELALGDFSNDDEPPSENDYSVCALVNFGDFQEFICGDLDGESAASPYGYVYLDVEYPVARYIGDIDILRVNHHGSCHSTNQMFVDNLDPEVSIISVGVNSYGHPCPEVSARLEADSDVFTTVEYGHIVVMTDGEEYTVNSLVYDADSPQRLDHDGDGWFDEVDPDDGDYWQQPPFDCNDQYQICTTALEVRVNEVKPISERISPWLWTGSWVEVKNISSEPLDFGGLIIQSSCGAEVVPSGTVIPASGFYLHHCISSLAMPGEVSLSYNGGLLDSVEYPEISDLDKSYSLCGNYWGERSATAGVENACKLIWW